MSDKIWWALGGIALVATGYGLKALVDKMSEESCVDSCDEDSCNNACDDAPNYAMSEDFNADSSADFEASESNTNSTESDTNPSPKLERN